MTSLDQTTIISGHAMKDRRSSKAEIERHSLPAATGQILLRISLRSFKSKYKSSLEWFPMLYFVEL